MSFDLEKIIESKRALRRKLAAAPVAEKLGMLDTVRERELAIRGRVVRSDASIVREDPAPYLSGHKENVTTPRVQESANYRALSPSIPLSAVGSLLNVMAAGGEGEEKLQTLSPRLPPLRGSLRNAGFLPATSTLSNNAGEPY